MMLLIGVVVRRGGGVTCYTNVEKTEEEVFPKYDGWETCYTTYDQNGKTIDRGGSKKDFICIDDKSIKSKHLYGFMSSRRCPEQEKIYIRDCENTMNEDKFERICYCRYRLCNHGYSTYSGGVAGVRMNLFVVMGMASGVGLILGKQIF